MSNSENQLSDQELIIYLMNVVRDNIQVKEKLIEILSQESQYREPLLADLSKHPKLQNAPRGMQRIFVYLLDDYFAQEVLQYLLKG